MGSCLSKRRLANLDPDKVPNFSFESPRYLIRICDVYDGDTCTGIMKFRGVYGKFKIRMMGYDCPELKPPLTDPNRIKESEAAKQAKQVLSILILNKVVIGQCYGTDKYGRLLMRIYDRKKDINKIMIDCGYGYPYDGGKKTKFHPETWNPKPL
jgi:endonuclease YncB( thermonuclease family)